MLKLPTDLQQEVFRFYMFNNLQKWRECYEFIDPKIKLDFWNYKEVMQEFFDKHDRIEIDAIENVKIHEDFAYFDIAGTTKCGKITLKERWTKHNDKWSTRKCGLI